MIPRAGWAQEIFYHTYRHRGSPALFWTLLRLLTEQPAAIKSAPRAVPEPEGRGARPEERRPLLGASIVSDKG